MKSITHDELGYPINYDPSTFYQEDEYFFHLPPRVLPVENYTSYMVSNWGRLYSIKTGRYMPEILTPVENKYIYVHILFEDGTDKHVPIHRIICQTFNPIENPDDYIVNHKDGVKWHNEPYNLEWCTQHENVIHAENSGLVGRLYGEDNSRAALSDNQYHKICELTQQGYLPHQINRIMDVGFDITGIAYHIRNGVTLQHISKDYDFSNIPRNHYRKFSEEEVRAICQMLEDRTNLKSKEMMRVLGYDVDNMDPLLLKKYTDTISTIKRRVSYIEIGKDYNF